MSCQCYTQGRKEQACGILNKGYLYRCSSEKCNEGVGCTSYTDPYDTVNTEPAILHIDLIWIIIIVLVIFSTVVSFSQA